ncbi:DUF5641 domain-containing protein [Trichonephila clavipes]|nr:DUF5641 domain-containing protein [Trichonephila clavipes]
MKEAEIYLMKQVQLSSFYKEIRAMQNGDDICNKSKILNLSPFLDDKGIVRVGGRLKHSRLPYSSKHPILLPAKNDLEVLTPAHFLIGRPITAIVEPSLLQCESNRLNVWQKITKSVQTIWKRWSLSYLNSLQQRKKWIVNKENLKLGDMVLIREENLPPCKWLLGRVVKIYMGKDKKVRVVDIKTGKGVGTRHPFRWGKRRTQEIPFLVNNNRADIKITVAIPGDRRPPITPPLFQINKTRMNEIQKSQIQLSPHQKKCWASDPEEKKFHNSPPIKHIEQTKQISQAKRPTTDNSPPIKRIEQQQISSCHLKQNVRNRYNQAYRQIAKRNPRINTRNTIVAQVHQRLKTQQIRMPNPHNTILSTTPQIRVPNLLNTIVTTQELKMKRPHREQTNRSLQLQQQQKKTYNQITSRTTY